MADLLLLIYEIVYGMLGLVIVFSIWQRLGGWPEAYYRIARIDHFHPHVFGPDQEERRGTLKMTEIDKAKTPSSFNYDGGVRLIRDDRMARDTGRPAWYYNHNEMEPIDLFKWKKGPNWEPSLVTAAYENDAIERVHRLGRGRGLPGWFWVLLVVLVVFIVVIMSAYYNYNTYCAVKPESCGSGGVRIG